MGSRGVLRTGALSGQEAARRGPFPVRFPDSEAVDPARCGELSNKGSFAGQRLSWTLRIFRETSLISMSYLIPPISHNTLISLDFAEKCVKSSETRSACLPA